MAGVLLHPVALDVECWNACGLKGERFEYPGNGDRPLPPSGTYTLEELADEVAANYAGPLDLVGVSMGCTVAEYTALRHPDRVRSLFLSDGGNSPRTTQQERERVAAGEELINEAFPEIVAAAAALPAGTVLDGELLAVRGDILLGFAALSKRSGRRRVPRKLLEEVPCVFVAYDLLESDSADIRGLTLE